MAARTQYQNWLFFVICAIVGVLFGLLLRSLQFSSSFENALRSDSTTSKAPREAFVTMIWTKASFDYAELALVWVLQMKRLNVSRPIVVAATREVIEQQGAALVKAGALLHEITLLNHPNADFPISFTKLRLWELEQYDKIVYMDVDAFPFSKDVELMFNYPAPAGTKDFITIGGCRDHVYFQFNAGVLVIKPSRATLTDMINSFDKCPWSWNGKTVRTEQEFLNWYFMDKWERMPVRYGQSIIAVGYADSHRLIPQGVVDDVVVMHYFCKPTVAQCEVLNERNKKWFDNWWKVYSELRPDSKLKNPF